MIILAISEKQCYLCIYTNMSWCQYMYQYIKKYVYQIRIKVLINMATTSQKCKVMENNSLILVIIC